MIRRVLGVLAFLSSAVALASTPKPTIVLLTAVDPAAGKPFWDPNWNSNAELEKIFRGEVQKLPHSERFDLEVHHKVRAQDVWNAIQSPKNVAVFFVGHATQASAIQGQSAVSGENLIFDFEDRDVKDLFRALHPNLRFLGVVGCESGAIFDQYIQSGVYDDHPPFHVFAPHEIIDPFNTIFEGVNDNGLARAIQASKDDLANPAPFADPANCRTEKLLQLHITRSIPIGVAASSVQSVQIKTRSQMLALLPPAAPGAIQTVDVDLAVGAQALSPRDLTLTIDAGVSPAQPKSQVVLGSFVVSVSSSDVSWKPITGLDGTPMGVSENIYTVSGHIASLSAPLDLQRYSCAAQ